jgi:hypothetical protein
MRLSVRTIEGVLHMPKYVIERELPGAGMLSADEVSDISTKSNEVLAAMAPRAQWLHTYVTDDKLFCVYIADGVEAILEHASRGGFPADAVHVVCSIIDPTTGKPK